MASTLIVGGTLTNDITSSVKAPNTVTPADKAATSGAEATTTTDDDLPEDQVPQRLRGDKTFKSAVAKYRELESELGRKNNEVGQLRYVVDEMLRAKQLQDGATVTVKPTPVTTDALLTNPEEAITAVAKRASADAVGAQSDRLAKLEFEAARREFVSEFPTYETTMSDPTFIDWVKKSPLRTRLAQASVNGSFEAAKELFSLHAEVTAGSSAEAKAAADAAKAAAASASLTRPGSGGASSGAKKGAPPSASSKDIFSKAELRKLYMNDRDKYNSMGSEIQKAYAEGRVR